MFSVRILPRIWKWGVITQNGNSNNLIMQRNVSYLMRNVPILMAAGSWIHQLASLTLCTWIANGFLLHLPLSTRNVLIPSLINSMSAEEYVYCRMLRFFTNSLNHESYYIPFFFLSELYIVHAIIYVWEYLQHIRKTNVVDMLDLFNHNIARVKTSDWGYNMIKVLLLCREGSMFCGMSVYEVNDILIHLCTPWLLNSYF